MMRNDCKLVQDLLPLYVEAMVSEETQEFVEDHLASCADCRAEAERLKKPVQFVADTDATPLKKLKQKLRLQKAQAMLFTAVFVLALAVSVGSILTAPQYFAYAEDLFSVTENGNGSITIAFDDAVTGYSLSKYLDAETGIEVYHLSAWNTIWDLRFAQRGTQNLVLPANQATAVFYAQNNGAEDVFVYGTDPNPGGGIMTLPRLFLGTYFMIAVITAMVLGVLLFFNRKNEAARVWCERAFLLPVAYVIGHLSVKGLAMQSFSAQRDFFSIVLAAVLLYGALLLGLNLYRLKQEKRESQ